METKNLQELLKQLTQEREKALELKKESDNNLYEDVKKKLKKFIEDFRKEFYPLAEGKQGYIIGNIYLKHKLNHYDEINLFLSGNYKNFEIYVDGFMLAKCSIFEENIDNQKEINIEDFDKTCLKKYSKEVCEILLKNKDNIFQEIYDLIEKRILDYNEETLKIMKSL